MDLKGWAWEEATHVLDQQFDRRIVDIDRLGPIDSIFAPCLSIITWPGHIDPQIDIDAGSSAVIDQKIIWCSSINLLSYGSAQGRIMRLKSAISPRNC
ncbi:MAG: hypothetical protein C4567_04235 [Deltaproteobacteria bacterium]|nr:MAG: hypothetical protein C4567_04235 [Deltaproteobacteria bacterium]